MPWCDQLIAKVWVSHYSGDGFWLLGSQKAESVLSSAVQLGGGQLARVCKSLAGNVQTDLLLLHALVPAQPLPAALFWGWYIQNFYF